MEAAVALPSIETWADPELWAMAGRGMPRVVARVAIGTLIGTLLDHLTFGRGRGKTASLRR